MKTLYFKVTLLTDVILNVKAATEGPNETLDFIPGNNFLGIVASKLYKENIAADKALDLFHNGKVRFGDAHLMAKSGARTLKVPAIMYYPKLKSPSDELYLSLFATPEIMRQKQLKQCRSGFYDFTARDHQAVPSEALTNFSIKSAHDRINRTSLEKAMYGYESIQAGAELLFSVEVGKEEYSQEIIDALTKGTTQRIGRSRSAQYGLVKIEQLENPYPEVKSGQKAGSTVTVFADSRLIFIDEDTNMPTFRPTAEQLGLKGGKVNWEKSQIRTFQYAPWNFKRQCFDSDRCGIEKGSVLVVDNVKECPTCSQYVGSYQNEGFGRVIYNAPFLSGNAQTAESEWKLLKKETDATGSNRSQTEKLEISKNDSVLLMNLKAQFNQEIEEQEIFNKVNNWIHANNNKNWRRFKDKKFASQWGTIRSIATRRMMYPEKDTRFDTLFEELFHKEDNKEHCGYLLHGVAGPSWEENGRLTALKDFVDKELKGYTEDKKCLAVINLAAEMAKMYRKNGQDL